MNYYNYGHGHGHGRYEMNNKNKSALFSDKPCGRCGVCDTPELWRGAAGLCAHVHACAGAAESFFFFFFFFFFKKKYYTILFV